MAPWPTTGVRHSALSPPTQAPPRRTGGSATVVAVLVALLAALLGTAPAQAAGPTDYSNAAAITVPDAGAATPYPSPVTVNGLVGAVTDVQVALRNVSHTSFNDLDAMLVAPDGANLLFLSDAAAPDSFTEANDVTLTFTDAATQSLPGSGSVPSGSYKPVNREIGLGETFSPPAPTPSTAATFGQAFTGIDPNGAWRLYVTDDTSGDGGAIAGGWTLTLTTDESGATTSTAVASTTNPSVAGDAVTLTATVTSGGDPVTAGTVTFTADGATVGSPVAVNASGTASVTSSALDEGSHVINAAYSGATGFLGSNGTFTQVVDSPTSSTDTTYCNTESIAAGNSSTGSPYPSRITVSGLSGDVVGVTATLKDVSHTSPVDLDIMLAGPDADQNVVLLSDAGGTTAVSDLDLTFADDAEAALPKGSLSSGTFRPADDDADLADVFPAPAPTPTRGTEGLGIFAGEDAAGVWSLYVVDDAAADSGSIGAGWCVTFEVETATITTLTVSPNPVDVGQRVTLTSTTTGDGDPATEGEVEFLNGRASLGSATVDASGVATLTTSALPRGTHAITAGYAGAGRYQPSTSAPTSLTVLAATTTPTSTPTSPSATPTPSLTSPPAAPSGATAPPPGDGLPETGSTVSPWVMFGAGLLVAAGVLLLAWGGVRRRHASRRS